MASIIEPGRQLRIVVHSGGELGAEDVNFNERSIFYIPEEDTEVLFPELEHGQSVTLEGVATRGNENTNSIGFRYKDHIINCIPMEGSIVRFKSALFLKCRIIGKISREDDAGQIILKKPKIIFDNIVPLEDEPQELTLFEE